MDTRRRIQVFRLVSPSIFLQEKEERSLEGKVGTDTGTLGREGNCRKGKGTKSPLARSTITMIDPTRKRRRVLGGICDPDRERAAGCLTYLSV